MHEAHIFFKVKTDTPRVRTGRKLNVELLLASGHHDCLVCEANGDCRLLELAYVYGIREVKFNRKKTEHPLNEEDHPFILRDFSRCIQACNEVVVSRAISRGYRGSAGKEGDISRRRLPDPNREHSQHEPRRFPRGMVSLVRIP